MSQTICSCRICAFKAAYMARVMRKRGKTLSTRAPTAEPSSNSKDDDNKVTDQSADNGIPARILGAPGHHVAGFVVSLAHTMPTLAAMAPRAIVVAACMGLGWSNGPLVIEMISGVKASWMRCIVAMPPLAQRSCLLWLASDSRGRECRQCLRAEDTLCVRAAHAYWLDAGCATLAIVAVRSSAPCRACTRHAFMEHDSLPRTWAFMNAKGWKRKNGFTHLPQVAWTVQRNGTLVDPRGRMRDWTPVYPPPSWQSTVRALPDTDSLAPLPDPISLLISRRSFSDTLSAWIASYAPADERDRLFAPRPSQPAPPPVDSVVVPASRVRPPKVPRPSTRSERPKPPTPQPKRPVIVYTAHGSEATAPDVASSTDKVDTTRCAAVAQTPRPRLVCGSGMRCPAPSQMVCTDKRHVRTECDAGCRTCYHGACWRNRRVNLPDDDDVSSHTEPCPTPDCWGALVRVISVGGTNLVKHVIWSRLDDSLSLGLRAPAADGAGDRQVVIHRDVQQIHSRNKPLAGDGAADAFVGAMVEPAREHRAAIETPITDPLPQNAVLTTTTRCDRLVLVTTPHANHTTRGGADRDADNGPPSVYHADGGAGRKKTPRVRAQKRQRVRARERATWCAAVADGPLVVDPATDDDDLLWPEFFRP
ncbi:hypothetical protein pqer_cds_563 [Pandoravirus quercus]|uniref:E3 ubiquitin-protein ligase TTC3/DZIP3 domain-containing protein n=2 Tax=Pandoravirus TaxID=2060084 RepID=A0A2U7U9C4_9VIRU|nr:hypothetical protein pqer_cds_563 [Pandoravirus quercus]AVK74985.1 hypothetical protein pqer_cds_563 [Pandoravirus quercus]QBZ81173.1 hypothetical protein pclt_cds_580 [Pandoravirus celtis]